jgi:hypothetical protein
VLNKIKNHLVIYKADSLHEKGETIAKTQTPQYFLQMIYVIYINIYCHVLKLSGLDIWNNQSLFFAVCNDFSFFTSNFLWSYGSKHFPVPRSSGGY